MTFFSSRVMGRAMFAPAGTAVVTMWESLRARKRIAWGDGNANIDDFSQRADEKHGVILLGETPRRRGGDLS
jgi:hypothetical protein